jgi:hypothetical protein
MHQLMDPDSLLLPTSGSSSGYNSAFPKSVLKNPESPSRLSGIRDNVSEAKSLSGLIDRTLFIIMI